MKNKNDKERYYVQVYDTEAAHKSNSAQAATMYNM
jgi:hypothetical protein